MHEPSARSGAGSIGSPDRPIEARCCRCPGPPRQSRHDPHRYGPRAMILIAYDGTVHSDHAITVAGALLRGGRAHVLHIWEPLAQLPITAVSEDAVEAAVQGEKARAGEIAEAGAELARLE